MANHRHINLCIAGDGWTENGGLLSTTAETMADAVAAVRAAGYELAEAEDAGDTYDAEDGPGIAGYEPDGLGVYIIPVLPRE